MHKTKQKQADKGNTTKVLILGRDISSCQGKHYNSQEQWRRLLCPNCFCWVSPDRTWSLESLILSSLLNKKREVGQNFL